MTRARESPWSPHPLSICGALMDGYKSSTLPLSSRPCLAFQHQHADTFCGVSCFFYSIQAVVLNHNSNQTVITLLHTWWFWQVVGVMCWGFGSVSTPPSSQLWVLPQLTPTHAHTHTHAHLYKYICICMCSTVPPTFLNPLHGNMWLRCVLQ